MTPEQGRLCQRGGQRLALALAQASGAARRSVAFGDERDTARRDHRSWMAMVTAMPMAAAPREATGLVRCLSL
jgi:hypothetical protein